MKFDTDGVYTLVYTAEDDCGNTATEERTVNVISYNTVLFTDGTFIINEKSTDRDANVALHGAVTNEYISFDPNGATNKRKYIFDRASDRPWLSEEGRINSVEIGTPISPTSTAYWFYDMRNCTEINLTNLNTNSVTNMNGMFGNCYVVTSLDVSNFNTSKVTNMSEMFFNCRTVTSLDVSNFNTSKVTNMSEMFAGCQAVTSLDVSNFNTSNVTDMNNMFLDCYVLTSLDVSNFNTGNVTDMTRMFSGCYVLASLDVSNFNTGNVTDMARMFSQCSVLASLDVSNFNTSKVTNMSEMFAGCRTVTSLDVSNFDTSNVTNMQNMFSQCFAMITIYASTLFVTDQVTVSGGMFNYMSTSLVGGAGTTWNSSNPTNKTYAHIDGGTSNPGYFTAKAA